MTQDIIGKTDVLNLEENLLIAKKINEKATYLLDVNGFNVSEESLYSVGMFSRDFPYKVKINRFDEKEKKSELMIESPPIYVDEKLKDLREFLENETLEINNKRVINILKKFDGDHLLILGTYGREMSFSKGIGFEILTFVLSNGCGSLCKHFMVTGVLIDLNKMERIWKNAYDMSSSLRSQNAINSAISKLLQYFPKIK